MQNDTSRRGTRTNKICSAPLTIPKSLQQNAAPQLAPEQQQLLLLRRDGEQRDSRDGLCSGASLVSGLLGHNPHPPHVCQQTNPIVGTAPGLHLCQPCDTEPAGDVPGQAEQAGDGVAFPRHRLHSEAAQGWQLSWSRLCKQTIVFNCHWLFLSLFSHFLKSLT